MNPTRCTINRGPWLPPIVLSSNFDLSESVAVSAAEPASTVAPNVATPQPAPQSANVITIPAADKSDELTSTESHSCAQTTGEGVEPSKNLGVATTQPTDAPSDPVFCSHISPAGRHCRMLPAKDHPSLCAHHARKSRRRQEPPPARLRLGTQVSG